MINVFIADDHAMMREGVRRIIVGAPEMTVVGEAVSGDEVLDKVAGLECDILMLDMTMPGISGLELIKSIKKRHPRLPILILSMHNAGKIVAAALKAGADGYLTKDSDPDRLVDVIRTVAGGGKYIDPLMAQSLIFGEVQEKQAHEYLSEREFQIFLMIVAGKSTSQIANELYLSAKTVSTHKKKIFEKMKVTNTAELVRYALEHQLNCGVSSATLAS